MRRTIYPLLVVLLLCGGARLSAQEYYTTSVAVGTYTELENATVVIGDSSQIVNEFSGVGIKGPFTIEAFGQTLDFSRDPSPVIFAGGFIAVDVTAKQRLYVFDGFTSKFAWRDSSTSVSMALEGRQGEGVLKVQWKNMALAGNPAGDFANMQIWFREKDNSFEVHVGPNHVTGTAGYFGNNGPAIGGFVTTYDFTRYDLGLHLTGDPAKPGVNNTPLGYYPLSATPANGTIYRFAYKKSSSSVAAQAHEESGAAIAFLPNPFGDRTRLHLPAKLRAVAAGGTLTLHDALGREALRVDDVADGAEIERGTLPAGVYYVTVRKGDQVFNGGTVVVN